MHCYLTFWEVVGGIVRIKKDGCRHPDTYDIEWASWGDMINVTATRY